MKIKKSAAAVDQWRWLISDSGGRGGYLVTAAEAAAAIVVVVAVVRERV